MKTTHSAPRSGLVLMMVMVMMALLATLVMSFLLMVSQTRIPEGRSVGAASGEASIHAGLAAMAIEQLLVGPGRDTAPIDKSVIGPHSILENLYGHPVYCDAMGTPFRLLENTLSSPLTDDGFSLEARSVFPAATPTDLSPLSLMGTVITFTDMTPPVSLRITDVRYDGSTPGYVDLTIPGAKGLSGSYIINGAPFSGTGIGFDDNRITTPLGSPRLSLKDGNSVLSALRPNPLAPAELSTPPSTYTGILSSRVAIPDPASTELQEYLHSLRYGLTSANPDYTDADYNTMFLAKQVVDNTGTVTNITPSFHRPNIIDPAIITADDWEALRKQVMRPLPYDHPDFSGGRPELKWQSGMTVQKFTDALGDPMASTSAYDVDNDGNGVAESIWMDIGLSNVSLADSDGIVKTYRPLVAYLVLDLDGRIDINAHGRNVPGGTSFLGGSTTGSGTGPAEMDLRTSGLGEILEGKPSVPPVFGRYGATREPFFVGSTHPLDRYNIVEDLTNHPIFGGRYPDLWGTFSADFSAATAGGTDAALDVLGQRQFINSVPLTGLLANNPYLFNPNPDDATTDDGAFKLETFVSLLCSRDRGGPDGIDAERLRKILFADEKYPDPTTTEMLLRNWLTPISADIPSPPMSIGTDLSIYDRIWNMVKTPADGNEETRFWAIYNALPADIRAGRKIDINYAATLNATLPASPTAADYARVLSEKARFAQSLFVLLCVICDDEIKVYANTNDFGTGVPPAHITIGKTTEEFIYKRLAQWCVNIVDFTDADQTMTPFVIPTAPTRATLFTTPAWLGKPLDDSKSFSDLANTNNRNYTEKLLMGVNPGQDLWGLERPNIVITETLAMHNRRTRLINDGSGLVRKQFGVPQGSAFIELYNASTPNAPYSGTRQNVNLAEVAVGTFVWRLAVGKAIHNSPVVQDEFLSSKSKRDVDAPLQPYEDVSQPNNDDVERYVWFGTVATDAVPPALTAESYYANTPIAPLNPNNYLVVGPRRYTSTTAKADDNAPLTVHTDPDGIDLHGLVGTRANNPVPVIATNNTNTGFSVSEPFAGYSVAVKPGTNGELQTSTTTLLSFDGMKTGTYEQTIEQIDFYKPVFLQRLADPTRGYDPVSNPYITVDWSIFDLTVFDADDNATTPAPPPLASRQWGRKSVGDYPNLWARRLTSPDFNEPTGSILAGYPASPTLKKWDWTNATVNFKDVTFTLGYLNSHDVLTDGPKDDVDPDTSLNEAVPADYEKKYRYNGRPPKPFTYLHWNDAPLASSLELMQVSASSPARFGVEFDPTQAAGYPASSHGSLGYITSSFTHRLNFFHASSMLGETLNLAKIFDYITVPSLFAGTVDVDPITGNAFSRYREPGKVNINTMNEKTYDALVGSRVGTMTDFSTSADNVVTSRNTQPFRAADAFDRIPNGAAAAFPLQSAVNVAPLRQVAVGTNDPLFAKDANASDNTQHALESLQRLSEMTTTRSNTFAVWVTIGLFEVNTDIKDATDLGAKYPPATYPHFVGMSDDYFRAVYPNGVIGQERGSQGEAAMHRFRDLYIIDRTKPVGFRRGELHNARDVIIYRTWLQ